MTKSSASRLRRRRPPEDIRDDPDRITIEFALALKAAWGLSERAAFDLAVAWCESRVTEPTKTPRGSGKRPGLFIGHELFFRLPLQAARLLCGRKASDIARASMWCAP
jgi:hypothetical protein